MKLQLLAHAAFAVLLSIPGFASANQAPLFKTCLQTEDSLNCSADKYEQWKENLQQKLQSSVPLIEDSIYLRYEVGQTKVQVSESFALSSKNQLKQVTQALNSLHSQLSVPDTSLTYVLVITTSIPEELERYPELEEVKHFPTVENCSDYNGKGKKACFRYLASYTNAQLKDEGWKGLGNFDLYFTKGKLSAIKVQERFLDPYAHDRLVSYFNQNYDTYVNEISEDWNNFKIHTKIQTIYDSTDRYEYSMNRMQAEAQRPGTKYFLESLFDMANNFYSQARHQKKAEFLKSQLNAGGLPEDSIYIVWGKVYRMDSIYNYEPQEKEENLHFGEVDRVPVYDGCDADDNNEKLKTCFQQKLIQHVARNFKFPEEARKQGIQGKTYVGFVIDTTGTFHEIEVKRPVHPLLDFEGIRVVSQIPDAEAPALQRNKPVRTSFILPINAKLR